MIWLRALLFVTGAVFIFLFAFSLTRRRNHLARLFAIMSLAILVYTFGYAFELGSKSLDELRFWLKLEYFGLPFIPVFWFMFAYKFHFNKSPSFLLSMAVLVIPVATVFFSATNDYLHFHYAGVSAISVDGLMIAQLEKGPWYYVFTAYSNFMIALSLVIFFMEWKKSGFRVGSSLFWMIAGSLYVAVLELLYLFGFSPYNIDLTSFAFLGAGICQAIAIFRFDFLKSDDLGKDVVFSSISEGILILDAEGRISDFNKAGQKVFPWLNSDSIGKKIGEFENGAELDVLTDRRKEIRVARGDKNSYFEVRMTELVDNRKLAGKVFMFKDVTALRRILRTLYRLANYDTLTKVLNRRRFFDEAEKEVSRCVRYGKRLSLLMLDLDHFKRINDQYGHQGGDVVLAEVGRTMHRRIRESDILGRYGGEEFAIILVEIEPEKAFLVAEDIRKSIENLNISYKGAVIKTSASIGIVTTDKEDSNLSLEFLLAEADKALYCAKTEGRNICIAQSSAGLGNSVSLD